MIFQFQTGSVTFFEEDQAYFEKRYLTLKKKLGSGIGDEDTVKVDISVQKNKHSSGDIFEASTNLVCPHNGHFHAEVSAPNIKECADKLVDKLQAQIKKFHDKK